MANAAHDALFVIHQDVDLARLGETIRKHGWQRVALATTHHLMGGERTTCTRMAREVRIHAFADLLDDGELQACDDQATAALKPLLSRRGFRARYIPRFIDRSLENKNAAACQKLMQRCSPRRIYCAVGLGIHAGFWQRCKAQPLHTGLADPVRPALQRWRRRLRMVAAPKFVHMLCDKGVCYVFLTDVARLSLDDAYGKMTRIPVSTIRWLLAQKTPVCGRRLLAGIIRRRLPGGHRPVLATTIHQYRALPGPPRWPLTIFIDGYHPPNYSRSYIDVYPPEAVFVSADPFSRRWFRVHGRRVEPAPRFVRTPRMQPAAATGGKDRPTVLLVLNHAGDWSALVNRSDTDRLVEAFAEAAQQLPGLDFVVRPHPTMVLPEHEGPNSLLRIRRYVAWRGLDNLTVSTVSLAEDIRRGDIFVSEYSQVLIDAWQSGKLGIVANMTGRRSFMQAYETMGFPAVDTASGLIAAVEEMWRHPADAARRQNRAAAAYNRLIKGNPSGKEAGSDA